MRAVRGVGCIEKLIDLDVRIEYSSASVYRDRSFLECFVRLF